MSESDIAAEVIKVNAAQWLLDSYGPYAHYIIRSRALIDQAEGLKPVVRRILWTMFKDGLGADSKHMKAARVAGNVLAFHPHGSSSIEDAMSRMAQGFALRVPLIDCYGSVGFVTGDVAAAARYWEARLTPAAVELLREIREGGVVMGKNFDGELDEPPTLPVRWPVTLINGTQGIAVGYASNMFSHNPDEIMDAARAVLKNPDIKIEKLMKLAPGPDLPTGGELMGVDGIKEYYETGTGSFVVRGRYNVEALARGKMRIIFYELPYQVSAEDIMKRVIQLQGSGKFKELATVKDLTDKKNGLRLVFETKAGVNHLPVIQQLFKETKLEERYSVNSTVLVEGRPIRTGIIDILKGFLQLRREVTALKATVRLGKIEARQHQLSAILAVLIDIDKAIKIIRGSETVALANEGLRKAFKIDEEQADYILSMQLRRLTKQDSLAIQKEKDDLDKEAARLNEILSDPVKLDAQVDQDLLDTKKIISSPRRTIITGMTSEDLKEEQKAVAAAAKVADKPADVYITRFADGRLLRTAEPFTYLGQKALKHSPILDQIKVRTDEKFVVISSDGTGHYIPVTYVTQDLISTAKNAGVSLPSGVRIVGIAPGAAGHGIAIGTKNGVVKVTKIDWPNKETFPVIRLDDKDEIVNTRWIPSDAKDTYFYFASKNSNILVFPADAVRPSGAAAAGVAGFKLGSGDAAVAFGWLNSLDGIVLSSTKSSVKVTALSDISVKGRGGQGVALQGLDKGETLTAAFAGEGVVMAATDIGAVFNNPPTTRRAAKGTKVPGAVNFGYRDALLESSPKGAVSGGLF